MLDYVLTEEGDGDDDVYGDLSEVHQILKKWEWIEQGITKM